MKLAACAVAIACLAAAAAAHPESPSPIPAGSPTALQNARVDREASLEGSVFDHAVAPSARRIEVNVGEVPNVYTPPPSNDRVHNPRTRTESSWTTQQHGTSATGMWPMPSTSGQPGTLQ